jgi:tetraacyldisaccharide 4'-kinase
LAVRLPDVPHVQDPDRVAAARRAVAEFGCRVIVLDDGFQHRRLARDLDLVLLDALEPLGFGHVFPRGTLREPVAGLRRAQLVALSRADLLDAAAREAIRRQVAQLAPQAAWAEAAHQPRCLRACAGRQASLDQLAGQPVAAFCGLGNPAGFRRTLAGCGYRLAGFQAFPDHHVYGPRDVEQLTAWAEGLDVAAVLCTHKDLVKLNLERLGRRPLWAVEIEWEILAGRERLERLLEGVLRKRP